MKLLWFLLNFQDSLFPFITSCERNVPHRQSNRESSSIWLTEEEEVTETVRWSLNVATANIILI